MALKHEVMEFLRIFPGSTDSELEKKLKKNHQHINKTCRTLEAEGYLVRKPNPEKNNYLGNFLTGKPLESAPSVEAHGNGLDEDTVKACIKNRLEQQGWAVTVAWGKTHGVDIEAANSNQRWLIEVKGCGSRYAMRHNYFLSILGETLQRMNDARAQYSIAFPDMPVYRGLWNRLPALATQRTGITLLLVSENGHVTVLN